MKTVPAVVPYSRYRFDVGDNAPKLFYDAYRPIESGGRAEVSIMLIHGYAGADGVFDNLRFALP